MVEARWAVIEPAGDSPPPTGVLCSPLPNPKTLIRKYDPQTDPEPPSTVDEGNTELASLPDEAETIRLEARCEFRGLSGC